MNGLWTKDQNLKFYGIELGTRMTVIGIEDGLLVHSPIRLTDEIGAQLERDGQVRWIVAPNKWHHLFVQDFKRRFPQAELYGAPGLDKKRADISFTRILSNEQDFPWNPSVSHQLIEGVPFYNEVVFFHPPTKTLILTDLAVNIREGRSLLTRVFLSLIGTYGRFGWSTMEKMIFIRDKVAFRRSLENVLAWDFDRIVLAHGTPIETNGKEILRNAF